MILNVAAYHFVVIDDPAALAAELREACEAAQLRGTVLIAEEGVNLFLAGDAVRVRALVDDLRADSRFADMRPKFSDSSTQPFARLKVKVKPEIISFRQPGTTPLEVERAPAIRPADLARWIEQGCDDDGRRLVLLDTRNRDELQYGTFTGALTLGIDRFTDLPAAMQPHMADLADSAVVSFCTGGIRCEKAAMWLQQNGLDHVWQLDEGILGYFEQVGGLGYDGRCFVFDERVALDPQLQPLVDPAIAGENAAAVPQLADIAQPKNQ